jgi:hypothetical protein
LHGCSFQEGSLVVFPRVSTIDEYFGFRFVC